MSKAEVKYLCAVIKDQYKITDYVQAKNIEVFNRSGRLFIVCPFHDDHDPSLIIRTDGKWETWYCFGCKKSGTIIDFFSLYEGVTVGEAIAKLGSGIDINFDLSSIVKDFSEEEDEDEESELMFINSMVSAHCRDYLNRVKNEFGKEVLNAEFEGVEQVYLKLDEAISRNDMEVAKEYYDAICVNDYLLDRFEKLQNA